MNARRGAQDRVLRAMSSGEGRRAVQGAACPLCTWELRFFVEPAGFGRTMEQCTNAQCDNSVPHQPVADPDAKPMRPEAQRPKRIPRYER